MYKAQAETHLKEFFQHTLRKYYTTKERRDAVTLSWDFMMAEVWPSDILDSFWGQCSSSLAYTKWLIRDLIHNVWVSIRIGINDQKYILLDEEGIWRRLTP